MMLVLFLIILSGIMTIAARYNKKFKWILSLYMFGIIILFLSIVFYTYRLSSYGAQFEPIYYTFLFNYNINISILSICRIYNIGMAVLMFAAYIFVQMVIRLKLWQKIIFILPIVFLIITCDPLTSYEIYLKVNTTSNSVEKAFILKIFDMIKQLDLFFLLGYILMPICVGISYYKKTDCFLFKKHTVYSIIYLIIIDVFIITVFFLGTFKSFSFLELDLLKFPTTRKWYTYFDEVQFDIFLVIMLVYILFYCINLDTFQILIKNLSLNNDKKFNKNLSMIFHVHKNAFFVIKKLAEQSKFYPEFAEGNFDKIAYISDDAINNLTRMLNMLRKVMVSNESVSVVNSINSALSRTDNCDGIKIIKEISGDYFVIADKTQIREVFVNLITNAVEALNASGREEPQITIRVYSEENFVIVEVEDNGCGIKKSNYKSIFDPLFSTKQNSINWGIGLNYVKNVLKTCGGDIAVKSEVDKYTLFQVIMPIATEKRRQNYANKIGNL